MMQGQREGRLLLPPLAGSSSEEGSQSSLLPPSFVAQAAALAHRSEDICVVHGQSPDAWLLLRVVDGRWEACVLCVWEMCGSKRRLLTESLSRLQGFKSTRDTFLLLLPPHASPLYPAWHLPQSRRPQTLVEDPTF